MKNNASNNNLSENSIKKLKLPYWFKQLMCKAVGYFNGDLYRFVLNSTNDLTLVIDQKSTTPLITIFSRAYYNESAKSYPVESNSELKKLLSLEYGTSKNTFYHVWGGDTGQNQVNIWQFSSTVPDSFIKLPESLLLSQLLNDSDVILSEVFCASDSLLYVARNQKLIHSSFQTPIINSATRFSMAAGLPMIENEILFTKGEQSQQLANGLMKVSPNILASFIKKIDGNNSLSLLKKILLPVVAASAVYLLTTSTFLLYKQNTLQSQLSDKSEQVSFALQQQQIFDDNMVRYQALKQFTNTQTIRSALWVLMSDVFSTAKVTNIRIVDNRYVIRGTVDKATELLEQISNHLSVKNAKFDFPTRKGRGVEVFVISFELSNQLFIENKAVSKNGSALVEEETHG